MTSQWHQWHNEIPAPIHIPPELHKKAGFSPAGSRKIAILSTFQPWQPLSVSSFQKLSDLLHWLIDGWLMLVPLSHSTVSEKTTHTRHQNSYETWQNLLFRPLWCPQHNHLGGFLVVATRTSIWWILVVWNGPWIGYELRGSKTCSYKAGTHGDPMLEICQTHPCLKELTILENPYSWRFSLTNVTAGFQRLGTGFWGMVLPAGAVANRKQLWI